MMPARLPFFRPLLPALLAIICQPVSSVPVLQDSVSAAGSVATFPAQPAAQHAAAAANARVAMRDFFRVSEFADARLSPDGKHVAMLTADKNDHLALSVLNIATLTPKVLAHYADVDVGHFAWVNNHRLVYSVTERKLAMGERYEGTGAWGVTSARALKRVEAHAMLF